MTRRAGSNVLVLVGFTLDGDVRFEVKGSGMAEPVRARQLTDEEGRWLQQIVRRGRQESIGCAGR